MSVGNPFPAMSGQWFDRVKYATRLLRSCAVDAETTPVTSLQRLRISLISRSRDARHTLEWVSWTNVHNREAYILRDPVADGTFAYPMRSAVPIGGHALFYFDKALPSTRPALAYAPPSLQSRSHEHRPGHSRIEPLAPARDS